MIRKTLIISFFMLFCVNIAMGDCNSGDYYEIINSTHVQTCNCSHDCIQYAIDNVTRGMTILIPSGACTWNSDIIIPKNRKITLQGAGYNNTIITRSGRMIQMQTSGSRITGFGFVLTGSGNMIIVKGENWRIDNCKFNNTCSSSQVAIDANGGNVVMPPIGLIDNCILINCRIIVAGRGTIKKNNNLWSEPSIIGTHSSVFVENTFISRCLNMGNSIDANYAGYYVFRFNTVNDSYLEAHSIMSNARATRSWEIYNNNMNEVTQSMWVPFFIRAGTGVIFNNEVSEGFTAAKVCFDNVRVYVSAGTPGYCDGNSSWDGNIDANGWPCRDQIGRGPDLIEWENSPPGIYTQTSVPAYIWNNSVGNDNVPVEVINNCENHIKPDRDYYDYNSTFDGTSGVGIGTLISIPSTCTVGVGYWANDTGEWDSTNGGNDGTLYKCTATDTWNPYYVPFDYPHPLSSGIPGVSLLTPQNLKTTTETTIHFNTSIIDSGNLTNATLYGDWSGGWHACTTNNITGTFNETTFTKTLPIGTYKWNVLTYDEDGNSDWNNMNYTFTIESSGGTPDTKFEYYDAGWTEGPASWMLWFRGYFWSTTPNAGQSDSQPSLKITNNGTAAGTPKMRLDANTPTGITIYVDDDNDPDGAVVLTNVYQTVSTELSSNTNVTLWAWCDLVNPQPWSFETYAIVE